MRRPITQIATSVWITSSIAQSPTLIAIGLFVLIAAAIWPAIPAVTAMALVTLGATGAMLQRLRGVPVAVPLMLLHLCVYGGLYAIFVAASFHAGAWGMGATIDLAVSTLPIALALRQTLAALQDDSLRA